VHWPILANSEVEGFRVAIKRNCYTSIAPRKNVGIGPARAQTDDK
jgi:hypothetical protein